MTDPVDRRIIQGMIEQLQAQRESLTLTACEANDGK